jgi:hypothetical protein
MKKIVAGGFILLSGIILYLGVHLSATDYMSHLTEWRSPPGKFGTALQATRGETANLIAIVLCVIGFMILLWEIAIKDMMAAGQAAIDRRNQEYNEYMRQLKSDRDVE